MIENKKYYIKKPKGWNPCILGNEKHRDPVLNVLPNCVGWATGRFNEIGGYGKCKYLGNTDAENFINYVKSQNLEIGENPEIGSCMVWQGIGDLKGHVAIVEEKINNNEIVTSESGWTSTKSYWTQTRKNNNGNWGLNKNYKFLGFIYNPFSDYKINLPSRGYFTKGDKGTSIALIDNWLFSMYKNPLVLGNYYGNNTIKYIKLFQKQAKDKGIYIGKYATIDGNIGPLTLQAMRESGFKY